jgi:hypothetical protein
MVITLIPNKLRPPLLSKGPHPAFLLAIALMLSVLGIKTIGERLMLDVHGTITESKDDPAKNAPRYVTYNTLIDRAGYQSSYIAGPTDSSLPRSMSVGSEINKERWHLFFDKNGATVRDFPMMTYSAHFGVVFALLFWSYLQFQARRNRSELE